MAAITLTSNILTSQLNSATTKLAVGTFKPAVLIDEDTVFVPYVEINDYSEVDIANNPVAISTTVLEEAVIGDFSELAVGSKLRYVGATLGSQTRTGITSLTIAAGSRVAYIPHAPSFAKLEVGDVFTSIDNAVVEKLYGEEGLVFLSIPSTTSQLKVSDAVFTSNILRVTAITVVSGKRRITLDTPVTAIGTTLKQVLPPSQNLVFALTFKCEFRQDIPDYSIKLISKDTFVWIPLLPTSYTSLLQEVGPLTDIGVYDINSLPANIKEVFQGAGFNLNYSTFLKNSRIENTYVAGTLP
jgi:hypothetical protein